MKNLINNCQLFLFDASFLGHTYNMIVLFTVSGETEYYIEIETIKKHKCTMHRNTTNSFIPLGSNVQFSTKHRKRTSNNNKSLQQ
jgi:hypothetical protein